jgi:hypothetical protein
MSGMWRRYGAGPRHLLAVLVTLAFATYGWVRIFESTANAAVTVVVWFLLAIVVHDLAFLPLYGLLRRAGARVLGPRVISYVAVPAAIATLLLVAWLPLVLGVGLYRFVTTLPIDAYLLRWALIAAGLFLISAIAYAVRRR